MGANVSIMGPERTRRFWRAHGRSPLHLTLLHAFGNNPTTAWTPEGLSIWYGLSVGGVREVLSEFAACGIVCRTAHPADAFVWNGAQDWAVPHDLESRAIVRDRWISQTCEPAAPLRKVGGR